MKFCEKCGKQLEDDAVICTGCGCPTENWKKDEEATESLPQFTVEKEKKPFPWSLVSLILGIAGIVTGPLGILFGIAGIVLVKKGKEKAPEDTRFKFATILSIVAIVVGSLVVIVPIVLPILQILLALIITSAA